MARSLGLESSGLYTALDCSIRRYKIFCIATDIVSGFGFSGTYAFPLFFCVCLSILFRAKSAEQNAGRQVKALLFSVKATLVLVLIARYIRMQS